MPGYSIDLDGGWLSWMSGEGVYGGLPEFARGKIVVADPNLPWAWVTSPDLMGELGACSAAAVAAEDEELDYVPDVAVA